MFTLSFSFTEKCADMTQVSSDISPVLIHLHACQIGFLITFAGSLSTNSCRNRSVPAAGPDLG